MRRAMLIAAVLATGTLAVSCARSQGSQPIREALQARRDAAAPSAPAAEGLQSESLAFQGTDRSYLVHVPPGASGSTGLPALIVLHGGQGGGEKVAASSGMAAAADAAGFVALFPNAAGSQWNDGRATTASGVDDVGYIQAVAADAALRFGVDPNRVFVAGISNGGLMAQRLACEASGSFQGFGVVAANLPADLRASCRPAVARPMVFFNGTSDPIMPFAGGEIRSGRRAGAGGLVESRAQTEAFWSGVNGCFGGAQTTPLADSTDDGTTVSLDQPQGCAAPLEFFTIEGGGHTWPGSPTAQSSRLAGAVSRDIGATPTLVDFFRRHGL